MSWKNRWNLKFYPFILLAILINNLHSCNMFLMSFCHIYFLSLKGVQTTFAYIHSQLSANLSLKKRALVICVLSPLTSTRFRLAHSDWCAKRPNNGFLKKKKNVFLSLDHLNGRRLLCSTYCNKVVVHVTGLPSIVSLYTCLWQYRGIFDNDENTLRGGSFGSVVFQRNVYERLFSFSLHHIHNFSPLRWPSSATVEKFLQITFHSFFFRGKYTNSCHKININGNSDEDVIRKISFTSIHYFIAIRNSYH